MVWRADLLYKWIQCSCRRLHQLFKTSLLLGVCPFDILILFCDRLLTLRYGCNTVQPRKFGEMKSLYSEDMNRVFSGGLIYEFTQEPNNYGLVRVLPNKNVQLLPDFHQAKRQFASLADAKASSGAKRSSRTKAKVNPSPPKCEDLYANIHTTKILPPCPALDLIHRGVKSKQGTYTRLTDAMLKSPYKILDVDGKLVYLEAPKIDIKTSSLTGSDHQSGMYKQEAVVERIGDEPETPDYVDSSLRENPSYEFDPSKITYTGQTSVEEEPEQQNLLDAFLQKINWILAYLFDADSG